LAINLFKPTYAVCGVLRVMAALLMFATAGVTQEGMPSILIPNAGFELANETDGFARHWIRGVASDTVGGAERDEAVAHSGRFSLRIHDATPMAAYRYVIANTEWVEVTPETTYVIQCWARGRQVGRAFIGMSFEGAGEHKQALPIGDYDWTAVRFRVTVPPACRRVSIQFVADGVTEGLWVDDLSLERSTIQLAGLRETRDLRRSASWYPRTPGPLPDSLIVVDLQEADRDTRAMLTALQGIVNRQQPQLYLLHPTNPPGMDAVWLEELQRHGYTGKAVTKLEPVEAIVRYREAIKGVIVWDPGLPGSQNVAWALAGLRDSLPVSPESVGRFDLPIVEDLRGRWTRNVDAYRDIWTAYREQFCSYLLAWEYPLVDALQSRDVLVQHRVFPFWVSMYGDEEAGADPPAEMEFVEEILAALPGNVPVMGWPMHGTRGVEEYTAVRLLSEYGKWVPGTSFTCNGSVHSAVELDSGVFQRQARMASDREPRSLEQGRLYLSLNILDSGDAHWYWQHYQRRVWADPKRGEVPTGYGMNVTLVDALPIVAQWYYENLAPRDSLHAFLYMNAPVYACRFAAEDRERIWQEHVERLNEYRCRLGMTGVEVYSGGNGGPSASDELLRRYTRGMPGLQYVLTDLGRHADTTPDNAARIVDNVAVFRTMTNFRVWSSTAEVAGRTMADENAWLTQEIASQDSRQRPAFMSAMAVSWNYFPSWMCDLRRRLPQDYELVNPEELAELLRQSERSRLPTRN
jgi:hypothetical protein